MPFYHVVSCHHRFHVVLGCDRTEAPNQMNTFGSVYNVQIGPYFVPVSNSLYSLLNKENSDGFVHSTSIANQLIFNMK